MVRAGRRRTREALARKGSKSRTDARCRCRCFLFFRGERQEAARRGPRGRTARSAGRGGKRARAPRRPRPRPAPGPQPVLAGQEGGLFAARRLNSTNSPERRRRVPVLLQRLARAEDEAPAWGGAQPCGSDPRSRRGDALGFQHPRAVRPGRCVESRRPPTGVALPGPSRGPGSRLARVLRERFNTRTHTFLFGILGPRPFGHCSFLGTVAHVPRLSRSQGNAGPSGRDVHGSPRLHVLRAGLRRGASSRSAGRLLYAPVARRVGAWAQKLGLGSAAKPTTLGSVGSPEPSGTGPGSCRCWPRGGSTSPALLAHVETWGWSDGLVSPGFSG